MADALNRRKYNTVPAMKLQPISDDEDDEEAESDTVSDYERMDPAGRQPASADFTSDTTPLLPVDHTTTGDIGDRLTWHAELTFIHFSKYPK